MEKCRTTRPTSSARSWSSLPACSLRVMRISRQRTDSDRGVEDHGDVHSCRGRRRRRRQDPGACRQAGGSMPRQYLRGRQRREQGDGRRKERRRVHALRAVHRGCAGRRERRQALLKQRHSTMRFYEFESKRLFGKLGVPLPKGSKVATTAADAKAIADEIGGPVVLKSQVLSGGRMKAGGVLFADNGDQAAAAAEKIFPLKINGHTARGVLVEQRAPVKQ